MSWVETEKLNFIPVAYFYTENGVIYLHILDQKKYLIDFTLNELEARLNPKMFFRLNRQFIANIDPNSSSELYERGKLMVLLSPKTDVPITISREKATDFKNWLDMG